MRIPRLLPVAAVLASLVACATHEYTEKDHREGERREADARPPSCPGAFWVEGREYPDGHRESGQWRCPEHAEDRR